MKKFIGNTLLILLIIIPEILGIVACNKLNTEPELGDGYKRIKEVTSDISEEEYLKLKGSNLQDTVYTNADLIDFLPYYSIVFEQSPRIHPAFATYQQDIADDGGENRIGQESLIDGERMFNTQTQTPNIDTTLFKFEWKLYNEPWIEAFNPRTYQLTPDPTVVLNCEGVMPLTLKITDLATGVYFERTEWVHLTMANDIEDCNVPGAVCSFCVFIDFYPDVDEYVVYAGHKWDLNNDGAINTADLIILIQNYGGS